MLSISCTLTIIIYMKGRPACVNFMLLLVSWLCDFINRIDRKKPEPPNSCMATNNTWLCTFWGC